ncbi:MAG TPA: hypothetical protein VII47_12930 [Actinomycetota bacterium]
MEDVYLDLVRARVIPTERPWEEGIVLEGGQTRPFVVERGWSGPAGTYIEQWSILREGRYVVHQSRPRYISVRGMQAVSTVVDRVERPIAMEPGTYDLVFIVDGFRMGAVKIEARPNEAVA